MIHHHLDSDALLRASYSGAASAEAAHVAACGACAAALQSVEARRREQRDDLAAHLSDSFWLREREHILARAANSRPRQRLALGTLALASLTALAVAVVTRPTPPLGPSTDAAMDADRVLLEVYGTLNRTEPSALAPVAFLIPVNSQKEPRK